MFGKRKGREPVQQPSVARSTAPQGAGTLGTVIIPRSTTAAGAEPYALVQGVISFVNAMTEQGLYHRSEIPPKALHAYHADYYLAQVNNGGHSQFIHNGRANYGDITADIRAGLTGMGARAHVAIFEHMVAWVAENENDAAAQTGFNGGRAAHLDTLDKQFFELEKTAPMIPQSSRWIATWPELKVVDDADYAVAIARVAALNPLREKRLTARCISSLSHQMTDALLVGSGLACANCPDVEVRLGVGGGSMMEIAGEQRLAFSVRTNGGLRFCVPTETHTTVYEQIAGDNVGLPPDASLAEVRAAILDGRIKDFKGPRAGRQLAQVKRETVAGIVELAAAYHAPAALDLVLRRAGIDPEGAVVAAKAIVPHPSGAFINWIVLARGKPFFAQSASDGCTLLHPGSQEPLMTVHRREIAAHEAQAAACG